MENLWIGLDAGGTGSTLVVTDDDLKPILKLTGPALQARKMPLEEQVSVINRYLSSVDQQCGLTRVKGVGLGVAGAGRMEERQVLEGALKSLYPRLAVHVAPDSEAAHVGAFNDGDGVLVISGTGSIVWGRSGDTWHRAGGFGYLIGDEGSGMKIGMEGLSAAGLAWDGGPKTVLCDLLAERHGITDGALMVKAVYESGMQPSRFAHDVLEAASMGDAVCRSICDRQSQLLASQVQIVSNKMPPRTNAIVLWGGLQKNDLYHHIVMEAIRALVQGAMFTDPIHEPWVGAALMAKIRQQRVGSSAIM